MYCVLTVSEMATKSNMYNFIIVRGKEREIERRSNKKEEEKRNVKTNSQNATSC